MIQRLILNAYGMCKSLGVTNSVAFERVYEWGYFFYKRHLEDPYAALMCAHPKIFKDGHVLDVGANIGYTALLFSQYLSPGRMVYAFEPERKSFAALAHMVGRKKLAGRIRPLPMAVGARKGEVQLWYNPQHAADHRIVTETFRGEGAAPVVYTVPLVALDAFVDTLSSREISFIKIDVQGYESEVCAGMIQVIENNPTAVVGLEYSPKGMRALGFDSALVPAFFETRRYHVYTLTRARGIESVAYSALEGAPGGREYVDLIFSKKSLTI